MEVLEGGRGKGAHVCTWCAERFPEHEDLERHWQASRACRANRTVSNGYNPQATIFGVRPTMPGAHTLELVRRATDDD